MVTAKYELERTKCRPGVKKEPDPLGKATRRLEAAVQWTRECVVWGRENYIRRQV